MVEQRGSFEFWKGLAPVVSCTAGDGRQWRRLATQFHHIPVEGDVIPAWVLECVLRSRFAPSKDAKCAFVLQPAQVRAPDDSSFLSVLPSSLQPRLKAMQAAAANRGSDFFGV